MGVQEGIHESRWKHCRKHLGGWVVVYCDAKQMYPAVSNADPGGIEGYVRLTDSWEYISEHQPNFVDASQICPRKVMTFEKNRSANLPKLPGWSSTLE